MAVKETAISKLDLVEMKKLNYLTMGGASFPGKLDAAILPSNLRFINLHNARLTQSPEFQISTPNVQVIVISTNRIREISPKSVAGLLSLRKIDLRNNELSSVPDLNHLPLAVLKLSANPLLCNQSLCWIRMWPWTKASTMSTAGITCETTGITQPVLLSEVNPLTLDCHQGFYHILNVLDVLEFLFLYGIYLTIKMMIVVIMMWILVIIMIMIIIMMVIIMIIMMIIII